jgi:hypothetical protein
VSSMNCPSCGAPIEIKNRFSKVLVCQYCGTHCHIGGDTLKAGAQQSKLADFPSLLSVGAKGKLLEKDFTVMGRMRYNYGDGHYDEWFIDYDGEPSWVTEDEGAFSLYTETMEGVDVSDIRDLRAGQSVTVAGVKMMVKETGEAVVEGGEGELLFYVEPGEEVTYIDAVGDGKVISIEYTDEEVEVFMGRKLMKRDFEL